MLHQMALTGADQMADDELILSGIALKITDFDFDAIVDDDEFENAMQIEIGGLRRLAISARIMIGKRLIQAKKRLKGRYEKFVHGRLGFSPDSALDHVHLFQAFGHLPDDVLQQIEGSLTFRSLYALAGPNTPKEARDEVISEALKRAVPDNEVKLCIARAKRPSNEPLARLAGPGTTTTDVTEPATVDSRNRSGFEPETVAEPPLRLDDPTPAPLARTSAETVTEPPAIAGSDPQAQSRIDGLPSPAATRAVDPDEPPLPFDELPSIAAAKQATSLEREPVNAIEPPVAPQPVDVPLPLFDDPPAPPATPARGLAAPRQLDDVVSLSQWGDLDDATKDALLPPDPERLKGNVPRFNKQENKDIEWARWSFNPITGCKHNCPYCYARDIATSERLAKVYPYGFAPTLHPKRLLGPRSMTVPSEAATDARYKNVFLGSMADMFGGWVPKEWISAVLDMVREAPEWNFLCLTKFPKRMAEFDIPANAWMGTTVDLQARVDAAEIAFEKVTAGVRWLSCEPLIEPLRFAHLDRFNWIVIGGASRTANTPDWRPPFEWIADLVRQARDAGLKVYFKTNLGIEKRILELPFDAPIAADPIEAPAMFHYLGKAAA
jgi:protein gp37